METTKEEEETEVREGYDTVASDMSEVQITDDMDDPADLMMMKLDQTPSGNQPSDLHPHNTQESYPPALTATLPGPSDMQRVSCVYIVLCSLSTGKQQDMLKMMMTMIVINLNLNFKFFCLCSGLVGNM